MRTGFFPTEDPELERPKNLRIQTNGQWEEFLPADESGLYSVEEIRTAIGGGWMEIAHLSDGRLMVLDEQGKVKTPPLGINFVATALWSKGKDIGSDYIAGDVLVCEDWRID